MREGLLRRFSLAKEQMDWAGETVDDTGAPGGRIADEVKEDNKFGDQALFLHSLPSQRVSLPPSSSTSQKKPDSNKKSNPHGENLEY